MDEEQLHFSPDIIPLGTTTTEDALNLEAQIALARGYLENGDKLKELLTKRDKLAADLAKIDTELAKLLPESPTPAPAVTGARKCSLCGVEGHVISRKKVDGKPTCVTFPEGKKE